MVREANIKQATAEKQLKEAQGKVSFGWLIFKAKLLMNIVERVSYAMFWVIISEGTFPQRPPGSLLSLWRSKNCVSVY